MHIIACSYQVVDILIYILGLQCVKFLFSFFSFVFNLISAINIPYMVTRPPLQYGHVVVVVFTLAGVRLLTHIFCSRHKQWCIRSNVIANSDKTADPKNKNLNFHPCPFTG